MSDPVTDNLGGYATGELAVSPGDVLNIYVGGQPSGEPGGFNGGGAGDSLGAGGGGASDVRTAGNTLNDRVIVAGGGGGGGIWSGANVIGGVGGGLTGVTGSEHQITLEVVEGRNRPARMAHASHSTTPLWQAVLVLVVQR